MNELFKFDNSYPIIINHIIHLKTVLFKKFFRTNTWTDQIIFIQQDKFIFNNQTMLIISRQYFSIEGEYRKVWIIYRRSNSSKHIIGYIINDKFIWLSQFEIEMSKHHPNYLLWTSLTRFWDWILGISDPSWYLKLLQRNKKVSTSLCQIMLIPQLFSNTILQNLNVSIYLAFRLTKKNSLFYFIVLSSDKITSNRITKNWDNILWNFFSQTCIS